MATARQVRRSAGGAELDLHHWLAALLKHKAVAGEVLGDVDRAALAEALDRRLDEGGLGFPLAEGEALARAAQRARRAGHGVVTTADMGGAVVAAAAALLRGLAPPAQAAGSIAGRASASDTSPSPTRRSKLHLWDVSTGWTLILLGLAAVAISIPLGLLLSRQRSNDAEDAARDRVRDLGAALAHGDGDTACEMLGPDAADELVAEVQQRLGEAEPRSCEGAVQAAAAERTADQDDALEDLDPGDVDYGEEWTPGMADQPGDFEQATATVDAREGEVALRSENVRTDRAGSWTVVDLGPLLDLLVPR